MWKPVKSIRCSGASHFLWMISFNYPNNSLGWRWGVIILSFHLEKPSNAETEGHSIGLSDATSTAVLYSGASSSAEIPSLHSVIHSTNICCGTPYSTSWLFSQTWIRPSPFLQDLIPGGKKVWELRITAWKPSRGSSWLQVDESQTFTLRPDFVSPHPRDSFSPQPKKKKLLKV